MVSLTLITIATLVVLNLAIDSYQRRETAWVDFLMVWDRCEGEGRTSVADHGNPCS